MSFVEQTGFLREYVANQFRHKYAVPADPWPNDATVYQNNEKQSLIYEYAECLAVRAFLKMCDLPFQLEMRPNAEYISPTGRVPFLKAGKMLVGDFDQIVDFVSMKGIKLTGLLNQAQMSEVQAYVDLVSDVLLKAEMYVCWMHEPTLQQVTKKRYSSVYAWPLNHILAFQRKLQMQRRLKALGWASKSIEDIRGLVDECCKTLSVKLSSKSYFIFDSGCTELDALIFGHLYTLLTTELADVDLASIVRRYQNLVLFCQRIEKEYFSFNGKELLP